MRNSTDALLAKYKTALRVGVQVESGIQESQFLLKDPGTTGGSRWRFPDMKEDSREFAGSRAVVCPEPLEGQDGNSRLRRTGRSPAAPEQWSAVTEKERSLKVRGNLKAVAEAP